MTISHHLDTSTIIAYAAGTLDDCLSVVAACHIVMCEECRAEARRAEAIGGAMLETVGAIDLNTVSLKRTMEIIDRGDKVTKPAKVNLFLYDNIRLHGLPRPIARLIDRDFDQLRWKSAAPGIKHHEIKPREGDSRLYMLKIRGGHRLPDHGHSGQELTLVLKGAYHDSLGRYARGDVADLDVDVEHRPVVEDGDDCICVVATEAPLRFKGIVPRLMQPFTQI